jgi:hypothetical protein
LISYTKFYSGDEIEKDERAPQKEYSSTYLQRFGVNGIFHSHNLTGRTMALGLTQTLNINECQEYFLEVKAAGA